MHNRKIIVIAAELFVPPGALILISHSFISDLRPPMMSGAGDFKYKLNSYVRFFLVASTNLT